MSRVFRKEQARVLMSSSLSKYLDQRIPRYTGYPTAVQFGPQANAASYEAWLEAVIFMCRFAPSLPPTWERLDELTRAME